MDQQAEILIVSPSPLLKYNLFDPLCRSKFCNNILEHCEIFCGNSYSTKMIRVFCYFLIDSSFFFFFFAVVAF